MLAADVDVAQNVGFGIIAAMMIFAALSVVTTKNVVHAALWLVVVHRPAPPRSTSSLAAEFVAVTQVLVYIGAVMVLFLFGIMLTRAELGKDDRPQQQELGARHPGRPADVRRRWPTC